MQEEERELKATGRVAGSVSSGSLIKGEDWEKRNPWATAQRWGRNNSWQPTWISQLLLVLDDGDSCDSSNHSDPNHLQADVQPLHCRVAGKEAALVLLQVQLILQLKPGRSTTEAHTKLHPTQPHTRGIPTTP